MKSTNYGIIGPYNRLPPAMLPTSRGLATEGLVPVQSKYTHPQTETEYAVDPTTGAVLYPVPLRGKGIPEGEVRHVLVDKACIDRVVSREWVCRVRDDSVLYVVARKKFRRYYGINILRFIMSDDTGVPYSATPANGNWLDARLANIVIPYAADTPASKSKAAGRLREVTSIVKPRRDLDRDRVDPDTPLLPLPVKVRAQHRRAGASLSPALRDKILQRDGGICFYCEFEADQVDHIIPYSYGGTDDEANLIACCGICNGIASDKVFNTLAAKREYVRSRYGPYMERRYRRFLQKHSVCAGCQDLYNPQDPRASMVLCPDCYQAELREDA